MKNKFYITTYSAKKLLKKYAVKTENGVPYIYFGIDHSDPRELRRYVKSTDEYGDTAMFFQIREVVEQLGITNEWNEDSLQKYLIYVDFDSVFDKLEDTDSREFTDTHSEKDLDARCGTVSEEYKVHALFQKGIHITYRTGNQTEVVDYVPFDKSNSMSRQGKMSFVNRSLLELLNRRLNLDMTFPNGANLSKFYAYRGLYLSDALRVDLLEINLNSDSVIIVDDSHAIRKGQSIITAKAVPEKSNNWVLSEKHEDFIIGEVFDGEGIISFEYAKKINEVCQFDGATSYQVRMPFIKGMLHTVDFRSIIKHYLGETVESFMVKDLFGVERDVMKAEIIMPASMFKCKQWLMDELGIKKDSDEAQKRKCMEFYFEKFYAYNHALYISNTNLIYGRSALTKLNYQFLNTLAFTDDELAELINGHNEWASHPVDYLRMMDVDQENASSEEAFDNATSSDEAISRDSWKNALNKNEIFSHEPKIKRILSGLSNGLKLDLARGKILANGEIRYLSRDLLKFVLDILKTQIEVEPAKDDNKYANRYEEIVDTDCLYKDYFFMPANRISLEANKHYPIFRNPHLSRNEQCALKPYIKGNKEKKRDLYYRYFGHLGGIIMVAYNSLVPQALGGADFDGDIVKVFDDKRIRSAVLRGAYEDYKRKLPIIVIPSAPKRADSSVTGVADYFIIKDTFSNKIGQISNLSIRLGQIEYGRNIQLEHICAECTILTGLEIDAAKTGAHPNLTPILDYAREIESDFDYVSDFKEKIDEISKEKYFVSANQVQVENSTYTYKRRKNDKVPFISYEYREELRPMDKIPKFFFDAAKKKMLLPGEEQKRGNKYIYFDFLKDNEWKKDIDTVAQMKVAAIMRAYYTLDRRVSNIYKYRKLLDKVNYESYIRTILKLQYDIEDYEELVEDALADLFAYVDSAFDTKEAVEDALKAIGENNWPFLLEHQKRAALQRILGRNLEEDIVRLLSNFDAQGYNLLFFTLKDLVNIRAQELTDEELLDDFYSEATDEDFEDKIDSAYYEDFYNKLHKEFIKWRNQGKTNWKNLAQKYCKNQINDILENIGEREYKLYLLYSLKNKKWADKNALFFWEYVTDEDIREHVLEVNREYAE